MNNNNNNKQIGFGGGDGAEQQQQHHSQHLGVNRIGKSIRKSPIHQSNFSINPNSNNKQQQQQQQNPQPQVYNINKNDFRNVVQQLTGTPTRDSTPDPTPVPSVAPPPRPSNPPRSPSMRLHRIRPPPLAPVARPAMPMTNPSQNPNPNLAFRPRAPPAQAPATVQPNPFWANTADSPVSVYTRYLENSILNPQAQLPPYGQQNQRQSGQQPPPCSGLSPMPVPAPQQPAPIEFRSPATTGPPPPASMPSPSAFLNLLSPRSPYPLLSPRFQVPPTLSPTFTLSPLSQSGGLLGSFPQPPPSPRSLFPPSPSGFLLSPRWSDM